MAYRSRRPIDRPHTPGAPANRNIHLRILAPPRYTSRMAPGSPDQGEEIPLFGRQYRAIKTHTRFERMWSYVHVVDLHRAYHRALCGVRASAYSVVPDSVRTPLLIAPTVVFSNAWTLRGDRALRWARVRAQSTALLRAIAAPDFARDWARYEGRDKALQRTPSHPREDRRSSTRVDRRDDVRLHPPVIERMYQRELRAMSRGYWGGCLRPSHRVTVGGVAGGVTRPGIAYNNAGHCAEIWAFTSAFIARSRSRYKGVMVRAL